MEKIRIRDIVNTKKRRNKKICYWLCITFGECSSRFFSAYFHPEDYRDGAIMTFANIAMSRFEWMYKLDFDCAREVFENRKYDFYRMKDALGKEWDEHYAYMFKYEND